MPTPPHNLQIPESEYEWEAIRSSGSGGQHVNKVATAVQLRFDIRRSSLPEDLKGRLLALRDKRITRQGVVLIKVGIHRSQYRNLQEAIQRLHKLVNQTAIVRKKRKATRPTRKSVERRLQYKARRKEIKKNRGKVDW